MENIVTPNLPEKDISLVVMSTINKDLCKRVEELGIKIINSENITTFLPFEQTHPDMQIFHYNQNTVFVLKECKKLGNKLENYFENVIYTQQPIKKDYPNNVLINAVSIADKIICNKKSIDIKLKNTIKNNSVYNVNQGYTKCSTCVVSNEGIITSDKSIYKAVNKDIDVLLIQSGYIELKGTDYGFIGGCSFKINKSTLAFTGNIKIHPDYENIKSFCLNHNVSLYSLTNEKLQDIGSVIPILEKSC
jgi:hypothetical protein